MKLAPCAVYVTGALNDAGFEAYAVGGCCRDMLLGREPQDWDVCTSALPEEVMRVFPDSIPTGIKHGTVTVRAPGALVEVTTFRVDGGYRDHRRPDDVRFTDSLREDLARRDFTMNAIACAGDGVMVDPFGGEADIAAKIIRCVGDARVRFSEDALRMFRAVRFSAQLGFELDGGLLDAMRSLAPTARFVAPERVFAETRKALTSRRPERLALAFEVGLYDAFLTGREGKKLDLSALASLPEGEDVRFGALCAALMEAGMTAGAGDFMRALRAPGELIRACAAALDPQPAWQGRTLAETAAAVGRKFAMCAAGAMEAAGLGGSCVKMRDLLDSGVCLGIGELALTGGDIKALGLTGEAIGECQRALLHHVLANPSDNTPEKLTELIKKAAC